MQFVYLKKSGKINMNLTIDIGNSFIKTCIFSENKIIRNEIFSEDYLLNLEKLFFSFPDLTKVIISSVRKDDKWITSFLENQKNLQKIVLLDHTTQIPIKNKYESKQSLGRDRIALAVGAYSLYPGENNLIIDCGTAITYDVVDNSNTYLGGNISPGIDMRFKALNQFTQRLPLVDKSEPHDLIGKSTHEAITNGVIHGIIYEIDGYIASLKKHYQDLNIIMTGGDAKFFDKKLKNTIFVVLNLIPIGLNRILEYND